MISGHVPAGSGYMPLIHMGQLSQSGRFEQFDYGVVRNLIEYHQMSPPQYNLKNVTAPVAIYYAKEDFLTTVPEVQRLMKELPNVVHDFQITRDDFNHNDFIYGAYAPTIVYDEIVKNAKSVYGDTDAFPENIDQDAVVEEITEELVQDHVEQDTEEQTEEQTELQ